MSTNIFFWGTAPSLYQTGTFFWGTAPIQTNILPDPVPTPSRLGPQGLIEVLTSIIGESDNEIGGFRLTRLSALSSAGATTINVESVLDWPDSGVIGIDGVKYYYTSRTDTSLIGLSYIKGGVSTSGLAIDHAINSTVVDVSREWSAIELLSRALFVETAEGEDLDAIGRNLGVNRLPTYENDDQFREIIKVLAYNPKATTYGIELALTGLLGAGNFEIYEDLLQYPNTIFVKLLTAGIISTESHGKTFLTGHHYAEVGAGVLASNEIELPENTITVGSVRLHELNELFDLRTQKASALAYEYYPGHVGGSAWTYSGSEAEATAVVVSSNGYNTFQNAGPGGTAYYEMLETQGARITPESYTESSMLVMIPTGSNLGQYDYDQVSMWIEDGAVEIKVGIGTTPLTVNLYDTVGSGGEVGTPVTIALDTWYEILIKKFGTERVELWVNGQFVCSEPYTSFTQGTANGRVKFGIQPNTLSGTIVNIKQIASINFPPNEYWSQVSTGSVATVNPNRITGGVTDPDFIPGDVGNYLITRNSGATNPGGGNNNGVWLVDSFIDLDNLELVGQTFEEALVSTSNPNRIVLENRDLVFPDDLGKNIVIESGTNASTYTIAELRDPDNPSVDLALAATPIKTKTNICEVIAGGFTSEAGLAVHLEPTFTTEASLDYVLSEAGSITGVSPNQIAALRGITALNGLIVDVLITDVLSAQVLPESVILNSVISESPLLFEYYPFYVANPLGTAQTFMDLITAAGVIPEFIIE